MARHGVAVATVRAYTEASGAERVAVLLDEGGEDGTMLECRPGSPLVLTTRGASYAIPPEATASLTPLAVAPPRAAPGTAVQIDLDAGEVLAPIGVVPSLADGVLALARALGGRSVASADFPTRDPAQPLTIAARDGEGVVVAVGDQHFLI